MGFSIKVAPGVRVRASARGVRTSVGPRAARMHFGSGRTGFSTGIGPVSVYSNGSGSRRSGSSRSVSTGASTRALAQAEKARQAQKLVSAFEAITALHRQEFPNVQRSVAPPPPPIDVTAIEKRHQQAALDGVGLFNRSGRAAAKAAAKQAAHQEAEALAASAREARAAYQAQLDAWWNRLQTNDPEVVLATLSQAFEDNDAAAAPVGVNGREAAVVVVVPPESAVPERRPATTTAGNLTLKKLTKAETADFYKLMVCGYVLATVKEALAVAPGITEVRVVAIRSAGVDAYGKPRTEAVLGAQFTRDALRGVAWSTVDATRVVNDTSTDLTARFIGASKAFAPLDLEKEREIAAVLDAVDASGL